MTRRDPFARCVVGASLIDTSRHGIQRGYYAPDSAYDDAIRVAYIAAVGNRSKFGAEVFASARVSG